MSTDEREHCVYRAFDADGNCLYVGVTGNLAQRKAWHRSRSEWFRYATRSVITGPLDQIAAEELERAEILRLEPEFNRRIPQAGAVGHVARAARERSGLTRERLAADALVSVATIARFENLDAVPAFASLVRLAARTGVDINAVARSVAEAEGVVWGDRRPAA